MSAGTTPETQSWNLLSESHVHLFQMRVRPNVLKVLFKSSNKFSGAPFAEISLHRVALFEAGLFESEGRSFENLRYSLLGMVLDGQFILRETVIQGKMFSILRKECCSGKNNVYR